MENKTTNGNPEDVEIVGGIVIPTGKTIEIPPETAIRIANNSRKEFLVLQMMGEGYISEEDAKKLLEQEEKNREKAKRENISKEIKKATKAKENNSQGR